MTKNKNNGNGLQKTVFAKLYADLRRGRYKPGEQLSGRGLAKDMGASLTPVRESIQRLEALGAIEITKTGSLRIPKLSTAEIEQLYNLRMLVEGQAAAEAAEKATPETIQILEEIEEQAAKAFANRELGQISTLNEKFHMQLYQLSNNKPLLDTINMLWLRSGPLLPAIYAFYQVITNHLENSSEAENFHHTVLNALRERNPETARKATQADIRDGLKMYKSLAVDLKQAMGGLTGGADPKCD